MISTARPTKFPRLARVGRMTHAALLASLAIGSFAPAFAQAPATAPAATAASLDPAEMFGPRFDNIEAGISFLSPAGAKQIQRAVGDELVRYIIEDKNWVLMAARVVPEQPVPLRTKAAIGPDGKPMTVVGMYDAILDQMEKATPGKVLRNDVLYGDGYDAGVVAQHYSIATNTYLTQRAVVRANDRLYYVITLTTPAPRDNPTADPDIKRAVALFNGTLDSVKLIDQTKIRQDQDERLLTTRGALVDIASETKMRAALIPETWLRLIRNGKDIGYSYVIEEVANEIPRQGMKPRGGVEGVLVGVRSRTEPDAGLRVDTETWMWMSFDRRQESFSNQAAVQPKTGPLQVTKEAGFTIRRTRPQGEALKDEWRLDVRYGGKSEGMQSLQRELPPFYLPLALNQISNRMLLARGPKNYLFYAYVSERREVMARYVDVLGVQSAKFNGQLIQAQVIEDRIGLRGSVTRHYYDPKGRYLGSENTDAKIVILPTDRPTLERMYKDADLSRPNAVQPDETPAPAGDAPVVPGVPGLPGGTLPR
jgi:hypothetical protein